MKSYIKVSALTFTKAHYTRLKTKALFTRVRAAVRRLLTLQSQAVFRVQFTPKPV
jgi:hypothetical protein